MRLSPLPPLSESQLDLLERVAGRRTEPPRPFLLWSRNPAAAEAVEGMLAYCRTGTSIPLRLRTLAMLMAGRQYDSPSMWNAHYQQGLDRGLAADALQRLRRREDPQFEPEDERVFYDFADAILQRHVVSSAAYDAALRLFGEGMLLEIVACLGAFTISSYALNTFQEALRPEDGVPFDDLDPEIADWYGQAGERPEQ